MALTFTLTASVIPLPPQSHAARVFKIKAYIISGLFNNSLIHFWQLEKYVMIVIVLYKMNEFNFNVVPIESYIIILMLFNLCKCLNNNTVN